MSTTIADTAFARLDAEGRLLNSVLKGATHQPGRFGFRGDIALKFQAKLADEARPPEVSAEQVIAVAHAGEPHLAVLAGFLLSLESLKLVGEVLGELLAPQGKYFFFVDNIDISKKYSIDYAGVTFHILPIDEATVYNELLELLYLEKTELKKLDTAELPEDQLRRVPGPGRPGAQPLRKPARLTRVEWGRWPGRCRMSHSQRGGTAPTWWGYRRPCWPARRSTRTRSRCTSPVRWPRTAACFPCWHAVRSVRKPATCLPTTWH
jgi:hypothetical protein